MPKKNTEDQHTSSFLVRLPEWHREALTELKRKNRRPMTEEVQIALEEYYKRQGIKFERPES